MVGAHTKTNGDGKLPDDEVDIEALSDEEKTSLPSSAAPLIIPKDEEQDNTESQTGNEAEVQYPGIATEYDGVNCTIVNENEDEGQTEVMISHQIDFNADQDSEEDPTFALRDLLEREYWEKHERKVYEQLQEKKQQDPERTKKEQEMQRLTLVNIFDKPVEDSIWQKAEVSQEAQQLQRLKANKIPLPVARFRVRGDYDEMDEFDGYDPEISRVFHKRFKVDLLSCDWQEPELIVAQSARKKSRVFLTGSKQKKKKDKSKKAIAAFTFHHQLIYTQKGALNKSSDNVTQHGVLSFFKPDIFLEEEKLLFKELFFAFGKDFKLVSKMMNNVKNPDQLREFYENQKSSLFDSSKVHELPRGYRDTVVQLPFDAHSRLQPVLKLARVITSSTGKPSIKDIQLEDEPNFPFPSPSTPLSTSGMHSVHNETNSNNTHNNTNITPDQSEKTSKKPKPATKKTTKPSPKNKKKRPSSADNSTAPATPTDHPEPDNNTPPAKKPYHLNIWDMPLFLAEMELDLDTPNDTEEGPNPLWMFHATPTKTPKRKPAVSTKKSKYAPKLTLQTDNHKDMDNHDTKDALPAPAVPSLVPLSPSTSLSPSSSPVASPSFQSLPHTPPIFPSVPLHQYPPFKFSIGNAVFVYYKDPLVLPRDGYWVEGRVTQKRLTILNKKLFWEYKVLMVANNEIDDKIQNKYHKESWFVEEDIRRSLCFGTQVFMFSEQAPPPKPTVSEDGIPLVKSSSSGPASQSSPLKSLVRMKRMHGAEEYVTMLVESLNHSNDKLLCGHNCTYSDMSINAPPSPPSSPGTPISPVSPADTLYYDYQELPPHHHSLSDYASPLEERDLASLKKNVQSIFTHQLSTDSIDSSIILQRNFDSILTAIDTVVNNIYGTSPRRNGKNGMHSPYNGKAAEGSPSSKELSELMVEKLCIAKKLLLLECKRYLRIYAKEVVAEQLKNFDNSTDLQDALLKMQQSISPLVELRQLLLSVATERFDVFRDYLTEHSQKKPQYDQIVTE